MLGSRTNNNCWYCERQCDDVSGSFSPTVDHFRPLNRFPQLAYEWTNWVFSCRRCNVENKKDSWPESGYVDPCASEVTERPEQYFDYNADTRELIPKASLSSTARRKAFDTIHNLGLNELDVRYYRLDWTRTFMADLSDLPVSDRQALIESFTEQPVKYAGVTMMVVEQRRRDS